MLRREDQPACTQRRYRVDRSQISFLKFVFEGYDGIAQVSTLDAASGTVAIYIPPGCGKVVAMVLEDLAQHMLIEPVDDR